MSYEHCDLHDLDATNGCEECCKSIRIVVRTGGVMSGQDPRGKNLCFFRRREDGTEEPFKDVMSASIQCDGRLGIVRATLVMRDGTDLDVDVDRIDVEAVVDG